MPEWTIAILLNNSEACQSQITCHTVAVTVTEKSHPPVTLRRPFQDGSQGFSLDDHHALLTLCPLSPGGDDHYGQYGAERPLYTNITDMRLVTRAPAIHFGVNGRHV